MLTEDTVGLWCRKDNTFYYLETGAHLYNAAVDRIKRVLVSRGLVEYRIDGIRRHEEPYKMMTYRDAKEKGFKAEPIYINQHVKRVIENSEEERVSSPWD